MMGIWEALAIAVGTGIISSIGTVAALKTEVRWIKDTLKELKDRMNNHSNRINALEVNASCPAVINTKGS